MDHDLNAINRSIRISSAHETVMPNRTHTKRRGRAGGVRRREGKTHQEAGVSSLQHTFERFFFEASRAP